MGGPSRSVKKRKKTQQPRLPALLLAVNTPLHLEDLLLLFLLLLLRSSSLYDSILSIGPFFSLPLYYRSNGRKSWTLAWHRLPHAIYKYLHGLQTRQNIYICSERFSFLMRNRNKWAHGAEGEENGPASRGSIRSSVMDGQRRSNDSLAPIGLLLIHFIIEMDRPSTQSRPRTQTTAEKKKIVKRGETPKSNSHEQVLNVKLTIVSHTQEHGRDAAFLAGATYLGCNHLWRAILFVLLLPSVNAIFINGKRVMKYPLSFPPTGN